MMLSETGGLALVGVVGLAMLMAGQRAWGEGFAAADSPELAEGANLRVMSFNILSEEWNDKTPVDGRRETVAATILHFAPDVVGLQEISDNWYAVLPGLLAAEYELVQPRTSRGETNYSGMAYHKAKVKLLNSGTDLFSVGTSTKLRLVTWGHYEKLDTGTRFVVMNTHWCIVPENRLIEAGEMADLFAGYREKFGCPVISVGDYNANHNAAEYQLYVQRTGMRNARLDAKTSNRAIKTLHALGQQPPALPEEAIDHILYSPDLPCLFHNTLIDPPILKASDHCPIYADFDLQEK